MICWLKKQKNKFLNLKYIDNFIKLLIRFMRYEHFHFVIWFILGGLLFAVGVKKIAGITLALVLVPFMTHAISLIWIPFRNHIIAKEKDMAVENAVALATFNLYAARINTLVKLYEMGGIDGCELNVTEFKTEIRKLIHRRCDASVKEIYHVHMLLNKLDPSSSDFIEVLDELELNLKEAIKYIWSIEKE